MRWVCECIRKGLATAYVNGSNVDGGSLRLEFIRHLEPILFDLKTAIGILHSAEVDNSCL